MLAVGVGDKWQQIAARDAAGMATRETAAQRGRREARQAVAGICTEFRGTRVRLGLS